jgi:hypothetical protein
MRLWRSRTKSDPNDELAFSRHRQLATALPFPQLNWDREAHDRNLEVLYRHAQQLANSAIDRYNREKVAKKRLVQALRWATFIFAVLGAILPVLRIYTPTLAPAAGDVALELSVVLIGIAAAFNFADQLLGASSGWRRSEMASLRLNEMLTVFCLDWNELEFRVSLSAETESGQSFTGPRLGPTPASPDQAPPPACDLGHAAALSTPPTATSPSGSADTGPQCTSSQTLLATAQTITEQQYSMVRRFCLAVLDVVREETSGWAEEFTRNASQIEKELRSGAFARARTPGR